MSIKSLYNKLRRKPDNPDISKMFINLGEGIIYEKNQIIEGLKNLNLTHLGLSILDGRLDEFKLFSEGNNNKLTGFVQQSNY